MTARDELLRSAITIEILTIVWMLVEGGVSLGSGISSNSVALTAFGIDSGIELLTAFVLLWRLKVERNHGSPARITATEGRAAWIVAVSLLLLCVYVVADSAYTLLTREQVDNSMLGVSISVAAVLIMPLLAKRKYVLAHALDSVSLRGDAACSLTCAYMAGALLAGLVVQWFTGWRWVDSVLALSLLYWLIPATREAFAGARSGTLVCECGDASHVKPAR